MSPPFLTSPLLNAPSVTHGFFGRAGGVSSGLYASLNTGPGSEDDPDNVVENRKRCAQALGVAADRLVTNYQVHSADVVVVDAPYEGTPPKADALVANTPGLALGALAADCMPWLFADPEAGVIGAAHAGWRGALAGVLENTVAAMTRLGAKPNSIRAAVGPCMRQENFEVGLDLLETFTAKYPDSERYFAAGRNDEKRQLDLTGFGAWRLAAAGVSHIDDLGVCTLGAPDRYFSYRHGRRAGESDYGRNLSAIVLR